MPLIATIMGNPVARNLSPDLIEMARASVGGSKVSLLSQALAADIHLPSTIKKTEATAIIQKALSGQHVDIVIQEAGERRKKALIADMDSTMIQQECIDELAAEIGIKEHVAEITAKAMNGEIEFEAAIDERVALLKGISADITDAIISNRISFTPGGKTLIATMKKSGAYTALVSGGFTTFTSRIGAALGFDENRANVLEEADGKLTGMVRKPILGAEAKVQAMTEIAAQRGLKTTDFIAVGDGANDLPMLKRAGTGVALHAKPNVASQADIRVDHGDLTALLYIQGYNDQEIVHG